MDLDQARERLEAERRQVEQLLRGEVGTGLLGNLESAKEPGDMVDPAGPLTEAQIDVAVERQLKDRLAAVGRALKRLDAGTYGRSVLSGTPIPEERLDADPAAELTVEEASRQSRL